MSARGHFANLTLGKMSGEELQAQIAKLTGPENAEPADVGLLIQLWVLEYQYSWGIRGDNTPESAKYLGYLLGKELYPDVDFTPFETYLKGLLEGKATKVYV